MDTSEIKTLLQQSFTVKASDKPLEDIVLNIIKTNIDDFTGTALRTIDYLEELTMLVTGDFNHKNTGENRQKLTNENDQKFTSHIFNYSIS